MRNFFILVLASFWVFFRTQTLSFWLVLPIFNQETGFFSEVSSPVLQTEFEDVISRYKLRPRTPPIATFQYLNGTATAMLFSAFLDTRHVLYNHPPKLTVLAIREGEIKWPPLWCVVRGQNETRTIPADLDYYHQDVPWVGTRITCKCPGGIDWNSMEEVAIVSDPHEEGENWMSFNSVPDLKTIQLAKEMQKSGYDHSFNVLNDEKNMTEKQLDMMPIALCLKTFHAASESFTTGFVEWVEYYLTMGVSRFVIYERQSNPLLTKIINYYNSKYSGLIDVIPWHIPTCQSSFDYYANHPKESYNMSQSERDKASSCKCEQEPGNGQCCDITAQIISMDDCALRLSGWARHIIAVDIDEIVAMRTRTPFAISLAEKYDSSWRTNRHQYIAFVFKNSFYDDCALSGKQTLLDRERYHPHKYWFLGGQSRQKAHRFFTRSKYIFNPFLVDHPSVHRPDSIFPRYDYADFPHHRMLGKDSIFYNDGAQKYFRRHSVLFTESEALSLHFRRKQVKDISLSQCTDENIIYDPFFYKEYAEILLPRIELVWKNLSENS